MRADYEVSWDKEGFFRNSRNYTEEKGSRLPAAETGQHRSEAPRRQAYNSRYSPDSMRPKRFKVRDQVNKFVRVLYVFRAFSKHVVLLVDIEILV